MELREVLENVVRSTQAALAANAVQKVPGKKSENITDWSKLITKLPAFRRRSRPLVSGAGYLRSTWPQLMKATSGP